VDTTPTDSIQTDSPSEAPASAATENVAPEPAATETAQPAPKAPARRQPSMAQVMESDEFSEYLSGAENLSRNALLKGVVAHVDESTGVLLVDVGAKSEGIVPKNEAGDDEINVGDEIEVVVLQSENDEGHPVLSKRRADFERLWRSIIEARDSEAHLDAIVTREVKGGLIVDLGVSAFIPASHVSTRSRANLGHMVGKTIPVRVIEVDRKKDKVIASHRLAADEERKAREEEIWHKLEKGATVEGTVRRITDFGAFIDIGGIDGLLHVREMAWNRVEHPSHIVHKGQKLEVLILDIEEERKRVALGLKQLQSDPWKKASVSYKTGQTVTGKITHIAPSCAFVELDEGIEAIIPISEMSEERIKTPEDVLAVGQEIEARVKQVQPGQRKITLSLRAAVRENERRETREAIKQVNERATGGGSSSSSGGGGSSSGGSGGDGGGALKLGDIFGAQLREARERTKERKKTRDEARAHAKQLAEEEEWDGDPEELDVADIMAEDAALEEDSEENIETLAGDEAIDVSEVQASADQADDAAQAGSTPDDEAQDAGSEETVDAKDVQ
jgi:4-hydroxy-3-methylbut-2-enyl diphosphate reductase